MKKWQLMEMEFNTHSFDFIDFPTIEFMIKPKDEVEVYIVEFESNRMSKSHQIERD